MFKSLALLFLTAALVMANQDGGDLDGIFEQIFGANSTNPTENESADAASSTVTQEPERCMTKGGKEGICVAYYACESHVESEDGIGLIDVAVGSNGAGDCNHYLKVCCEM